MIKYIFRNGHYSDPGLILHVLEGVVCLTRTGRMITGVADNDLPTVLSSLWNPTLTSPSAPPIYRSFLFKGFIWGPRTGSGRTCELPLRGCQEPSFARSFLWASVLTSPAISQKPRAHVAGVIKKKKATRLRGGGERYGCVTVASHFNTLCFVGSI